MIGCQSQMKQHPRLNTARPRRDLKPIGSPRNPDGSVNYDYLDHGEWWKFDSVSGLELGRGFVSNSRFASSATERVIPRTNRAAQRRRK